MQFNENDKSYLWDMLDASKDVLEFIKNMSYIDFENLKIVRFAVERQLLVVGEAAKHISEETKSKLPSIPWKAIIGLRNIIAHDYGEILTTNIWKVASLNIKELVLVLEEIV